MLLVWSNSSSWTTLNLVVRNVESMTQSLVTFRSDLTRNFENIYPLAISAIGGIILSAILRCFTQ